MFKNKFLVMFSLNIDIISISKGKLKIFLFLKLKIFFSKLFKIFTRVFSVKNFYNLKNNLLNFFKYL